MHNGLQCCKIRIHGVRCRTKICLCKDSLSYSGKSLRRFDNNIAVRAICGRRVGQHSSQKVQVSFVFVTVGDGFG